MSKIVTNIAMPKSKPQPVDLTGLRLPDHNALIMGNTEIRMMWQFVNATYKNLVFRPERQQRDGIINESPHMLLTCEAMTRRLQKVVEGKDEKEKVLAGNALDDIIELDPKVNLTSPSLLQN